ncbi:hypothetical protein SAMN05216276_102580 [Streptosporangium subroseum]|uniref:Uncharacterized protein n=1 Tax=Streptosporangium subroseum TaxID=106412 RepID=A0A239K2Q7_9ACTN|nr:hypothetical protein SAMN05216276_102580 [Streptosporangium subroseum]
MGFAKKFAIAWWKSFSACCWTMIDPAASHSQAARASVS